MRRFDMRHDGLYVYEPPDHRQSTDGEWFKISDPFRTPALVSDPGTERSYALWLEFEDEQSRPKQTLISASMLHGSSRDVCSRLGDLGLHISRDYQDDLVRYLERSMRDAPSADLATKPGWTGPNRYALPQNTYGTESTGRKVYYGGDTRDHKYNARGTLQEWQESVARPCSGNSLLILTV